MKIGKTKTKKVKTKRQFNPEIKEKVKDKVGKIKTTAVKVKDKTVNGVKQYDNVIIGSVVSGFTGAMVNKVSNRHK